MSFFDDASLAFLPSGAAGKDGKAYSIKPTDGTGDFTFSRGSNLAATRVGADGLIEKGRENLFLQSNQFDTTWLQNRINLTSGQSGYDGGSNAWQLQSNDASTTYLEQSVSASGVQTASIYAKVGTADYLAFYASSGARAWFNLNSGSISSSFSNIDTQIENVGNGWYRCSMSYDASTTYVRIYVTDVDGNFTSAIGANIYIQDAQLEIGLAATDVISTGATTGKAGLLEDEPRFDYSGGATCPSLLLEPSRTQLVTQTEYFGASSWVKQNCTITSNYAISPEGVNNASRIVSSGIFFLYQLFTFTNAVEYTLSFYVKSNGSGNDSFRLYAEGNSATKTATNEWVRHEYTFTGQGTNKDFGLRDVGGSSLDILIWGAQLEQGSYPTSYIPNHSGGSVTRGADDCTGAGDAATFNSTEGVLYAEIAALADDLTFRGVSLSDGTYNNRCVLRYGGASNRINVLVSSAGSIVFDNNFILSNIKDFSKIAIKWKANDFALWVNGSEVATDTSGASPTGLSQFQFADSINSSVFFYGKTNQVLYFPTALSDADLTNLTTL